MQIKELFIYGANNKVRKLSFELGKLNIITGESKSGKSAVGDIINYCLGGDSCSIADGVVRENSLWYGLLLQFDNERVFVARKNPSKKQKSTNACYVEIGENITAPETLNFEENTTTEGIESILTSRIGISENLNTPQEGQTRNKLSANIRHALYYCFQNQDEIAAKSFLFHRQSEPFITQSIKDTLPYFIGIVSEEFLRLEHERALNKRNLAIEERKKGEIDSLQSGSTTKAISLFSEAKSVGLTSDDVDYQNFDVVRDRLNHIVNRGIQESSVVETDILSDLQNSLNLKRVELSEINENILLVQTFNGETSSFSVEAQKQKLRLESIGLFEKIDFNVNHCPLCSSMLRNPIPEVSSIRSAINNLSNNIENVSREKPKLIEHINSLDDKKQKIIEEIQIIKSEIDGVYEQNKQLSEIRDLNTKQAKIIGRISFWLESIEMTTELKDLEIKIENLKQRISEIDELLDKDIIEDKKLYALSRISTDMTMGAQELDLEYSSNPYRLDMNKVTVVVDKPDGTIPLKQLGSGSNWVGVHLITYFALQKFFIQNKRPVPRFLFLDQPSQVYFPSEDKGTDLNIVGKIYDFIYEQVKNLSNQLQVIVVDHADIDDNKNFKDSVIENWRGGKKLIPVDWYEE